MASFNPGATDALGLNVNVHAAGQSLGIDPFDQDIPFDDALLDSVNGGLPTLPFTPTAYDFDAFSTTFEDPFSGYTAAGRIQGYDGHTHSHTHTVGSAALNSGNLFNGGGNGGDDGGSPQDEDEHLNDNKLLGFSAPIPGAGKAALVDETTGQFAEPQMTAELYGMFFVAEDVFAQGENTGRPLELTCYRRNLWQCSGQLTLPRHVAHCIMTEQAAQSNGQGGQQGQNQIIPITELAASITAIESIEGKPTEIISIPWKSSSINNPTTAQEEVKVATAPPNVPIDLGSGQELEDGTSRVSVPVAWKRLQFKHATANNGRRKGLQQHYVVQINLLAKTKATGEDIKIAEIRSGPVIVRGRSPRNFDSRKDVPLTGGDKVKLERRSTAESLAGPSPAKPQQQQQQPQQQDSRELAQNLQRYHSLGNVKIPQTGDWSTPQPLSSPNPYHPNKKLAISPNLTRPPVPSWDGSKFASGPLTPSLSKTATTSQPQRSNSGSGAPPTLPINLSLSEDERSPNNRSGSGSDSMQSPQFSKTIAGQNQGQNNPNGSPLETADMLYEYFPLSLDDWMPPVDAIYRPHVVHHTIVPPEIKAQQVKSKTKRYFAD